MKEQYHILWELILVVASVFIFRSLWYLLDEYFEYSLLIPFLIIGILLSIPPLYILNRHLENGKKK
jgi:hypothetical protein